MRAARLVTIVFVLLATPFVATAAAKDSAPGGPKNLRGFLLRPDESLSHTFPRTPAFAWTPVRGAMCYEFELGTSRSFEQSTVFWSNVATDAGSGRKCRPVKTVQVVSVAAESGDVAEQSRTVKRVLAPIRIPAHAVNLTLPWFTGKPYALWARVRAITTKGPTRWSKEYGFDMRWEELPVPMTAKPGLVRWRPVEGATGYEVWYPDIRKSFHTHTNVADQREFYFHSNDGWWATVRWRVRAVRQVLGASPNGLPAVSYGPWSPVYATTNPPLSTGKLQVRSAVSDTVSANWKDGAHQLMPGLSFSGDLALDGKNWGLFRVYAFTDRDCVNVVFSGSVVRSPAFAPRTSGPLKLPTTADEFDLFFNLDGVLPSGPNENAKTYAANGTPVRSSESFEEGETVRVDLPDVDAKTTRYFWTVVPVGIAFTESGTLEYYDVEVPQDACEAGRVATFAKLSRPAITSSGGAYVAGLSPTGRLLASAGRRPVVYSSPLVAWKPVIGATGYEVEWSRTVYPWARRGRVVTRATSAVLKLRKGTWYYRVRGLNANQVGVSAMTWSAPVAVRVVPPTFKVASR